MAHIYNERDIQSFRENACLTAFNEQKINSCQADKTLACNKMKLNEIFKLFILQTFGRFSLAREYFLYQRVILRGKMWMVVLSVGVIKSRTPIKWIPSSFSLSLSLFVINCSNVTFRNLLRINSLHFLFPSKK